MFFLGSDANFILSLDWKKAHGMISTLQEHLMRGKYDSTSNQLISFLIEYLSRYSTEIHLSKQITMQLFIYHLPVNVPTGNMLQLNHVE